MIKNLIFILTWRLIDATEDAYFFAKQQLSGEEIVDAPPLRMRPFVAYCIAEAKFVGALLGISPLSYLELIEQFVHQVRGYGDSLASGSWSRAKFLVAVVSLATNVAQELYKLSDPASVEVEVWQEAKLEVVEEIIRETEEQEDVTFLHFDPETSPKRQTGH